MRYWFCILFILGYFAGFTQKNKTTSYQNKEIFGLNITLNGSVKSLKKWSYSPSSNSFDTTTYIFNTDGFPEKIVIKNRALIYDGEGETVYNFKMGKLISKIYYENSYLLNEKRLKYDVIGRLIESSDISRKTGNPFFIETYQYNNLGQRIAYTMDNISGKIFHKLVYTYDSNGNKTEEGTCENYIGINDPTDCKYKPLHGYTYNKKGQLIKKFDLGKWSPNNTDTYYQYDEFGNKIDVKGYCITKDTVLCYHYVYQYDKHGNQIKEEEITGNYSRIDFDEYKYMIMRYDNYRNIIQQEYYTPDHKLMRMIRYTYLYDSFGNWIEMAKYEGKSKNELIKKVVEDRIIEYY